MVLVNDSLQYVAVYGGVKEIGGGFLGAIQDFALLNLSSMMWHNMGMNVSEEYDGLYSYPDNTCCPTCTIAMCPPPRDDAAGKYFYPPPPLKQILTIFPAISGCV